MSDREQVRSGGQAKKLLVPVVAATRELPTMRAGLQVPAGTTDKKRKGLTQSPLVDVILRLVLSCSTLRPSC